MALLKIKCDRCDGTGIVQAWNDPMHLNGQCFKCDEVGYILVDEKKIKNKQSKKSKLSNSQKFLKDILAPTRKAINTCNDRHNCICDNCRHKSYCTLFDRLETQENTYNNYLKEEQA